MTHQRHWRESGKKRPHGVKNAERDSSLLFQFLDLVLDVLPHVAMEGKGQFTEGAGQHSSLK
jgi:hypothetical protein